MLKKYSLVDSSDNLQKIQESKNMSLSYYKKFLLNRVTVSPSLTEYIENSLATDDNMNKHSFHKIMLHNWTDNEVNLFEVLSSFFVASFIPVNFVTQNGITTFYTSSLSFVTKVVKLDFLFPYNRSMCSVDILLNDKTSMELFNEMISVEDKVSEIVSSRFLSNRELDLSNFCNDPGFADKKIHFYKLSLLAQFKILMLRMGRDTRFLNLSNNNLSQIPLEILNFFIKGDLLGVDLSNNKIPSLIELQRVSSKIEMLYIEGNPLCENMEPLTYIKQITVKFPRLIELDGIKINNHGIMMPFYRTFLITPGKKTRVLVDNFVTVYFAKYDLERRKLPCFYDGNAELSISTSFTDAEYELLPQLKSHSRNLVNGRNITREYKKRSSVLGALFSLPPTLHDLTTFTVDVIYHENACLYLIIDGVYKEKIAKNQAERLFNFRRAFVFRIYSDGPNNEKKYNIVKEMYSISFASQELIEASFKNPIRHLNQLVLIGPDSEEQYTMCRVFTYYTQLRRSEVEARLRKHQWDVRAAIKEFVEDVKLDRIPEEKFISQDDLSDISLDNDID